MMKPSQCNRSKPHLRVATWTLVALALTPIGPCFRELKFESNVYADTSIVKVDQSIPKLSIETLYRPGKTFSYVSPSAPPLRWVRGDRGESILLIKRDKAWMQRDLQSQIETPFAPAIQFLAAVKSLDGVGDNQAEGIVDQWLSANLPMRNPAMVTIRESIAVVSRQDDDIVGARWITRSATDWQEVTMSPDGARIAYVQSNDLYIMSVDSGDVHRLTDDGSPTRLNGLLDWVYQEEIYGRGNYRAYWWREDSNAIAMLRLDTAAVPSFVITDSQSQPQRIITQQYPYAGDPIAKVEVWCADLRDSGSSGIAIKPVLVETAANESLVTRVGWHRDTGELIVQTCNRLQSEVEVSVIDIDRIDQKRTLLRESTDKWLEVVELPVPMRSGEMLRLSDLPGGRRRLWKISTDGATRTAMTPDDFDVREILHVDSSDNYVIVSGDRLRGPIGQQAYRVDLRQTSAPERLTDESATHFASISPDGKWMIDRASSLVTPTSTWLKPIAEPSSASPDDAVQGNVVQGPVAQTPVAQKIHQQTISMHQPPVEASWHLIEVDENVKVPAYLFRPQGSDDGETFPVLVEVYGGPMTPSVRDAWSGGSYLFHQMLAQNGIGVMVVDNRSSGAWGLVDCWPIHRKMGEYEALDTIAAAKWLGTQDWVDAKRIALRGWSFGGYLTLQAMTHSDVFAAGIAGGSVADWRGYDAVYTERYMGLPSQNTAGYDATSPTKAAEGLKGHLLLIHGELDDNVHLENALRFARAAQRHAKGFDMMIYPGAMHGVSSSDQNYHLVKMSYDFLMRELKAKKD